MIALFGNLLGEQVAALRICDPSRMLNVPMPDELLKQALNSIDNELQKCATRRQDLIDAAKRVLIVLPPLPPCPPSTIIQLHKELDSKVIQIAKEIQDFALSLATKDVGAAIAYNNALSLLKVNALGAVAADDDQGRHLAAAGALILYTLHRDPQLNSIGATLLVKGLENSLFQFLAGPPKSPIMLQEIINKCPNTNFDLANSSPHEQWIWERGDLNSAKEQTMYWDCIFVANLWKTGPIPLRSSLKQISEFPAIDSARGVVAAQIRDHVSNLKNELDSRANQMQKQVANTLAALGSIRLDKGVDAAVETARKQAEEAAKNAREVARKAAEAAAALDAERRRIENEGRKVCRKVFGRC
jgi:hypothetical protein